MIKINLLKAELRAQSYSPLIEERKGAKVGVWLALVAILAGGAGYYLFSGREKSNDLGAPGKKLGNTQVTQPTSVPEVVETPPEPPPMAAAQATASSVEDIVEELTHTASTAPAKRTFVDLVPSERIEFQYQSVIRVLQDIKAITPPEVGFAQFIFTPPSEFYIHGLAYDELALQRFESALQGLQGAEIRPGKVAAVGSGAKSREFAFFGAVQYPLDNLPTLPNRVLERSAVNGELGKVQALAEGLGLKLRTPRLSGTEPVGGLSRLVFTTEGEASFEKVQEFVQRLRDSRYAVGVQKVTLQAKGDEAMVAALDLMVYVGNGRGG